MFKHILVPVDGSSTAHLAIGKAVAIAEAFKSAVTLIYVIDRMPSPVSALTFPTAKPSISVLPRRKPTRQSAVPGRFSSRKGSPSPDRSSKAIQFTRLSWIRQIP